MSGLKTDLNINPYFSDDVETLSKNYHRVLFKPEVAVQARELTVLQSILQDQIARFGDNILVEGTIVKGGNFVEETNLKYVKLLDNNTNTQPVVMSQYNGRFAVGLVSGIKAKIATVSVGLESQTPDLNTLYVVYMTTSNSGQKVFIAGENLRIEDESGNLIDTVTVAPTALAPLGNSYGLRCGAGILYQRGHFINFTDHLIIVSKYNNQPDEVVVGFDINEEIINSFADTTLLDNANGFNNYNAPGADRLKLTPQLVVKTQAEASATEGFLKIQEYQGGKVVRRRTTTQFNSINKELKKRTKEESGNYSLGEIPLAVEQSKDDATLVDIVLGKSIAYVEGARIEYLDNYVVSTPKPTDYQIEDSQNILTNIGHYLIVDTVAGVFDFKNMNEIELRDNSAVVIGKANLRAFARHSTTQYRAYLFNIRMNSDKSFDLVRSIKQGTSTAVAVLESSKPVIKDFSFKAALFDLGKTAVKTLPSDDTTYVARTSTSGTVSGNTLTISLSSGEFTFGNSATLNSDQKNELVVWSNGTPVSIASATVTTNADATSLTIDFGVATYAGQAAVVAHDVIFDNVIASKKSLVTAYIKVNASTNQGGTTGTYSLGLPDVFSIEGIWMGTGTYSESNSNVTKNFRLYANQKDDHYAHSYVKKTGTLTIPSNATFLIKIKVFQKDSTYSFFSVDSYPVDDNTVPLANTIKTEQIPNYTTEAGVTYDLRNVVDFRPYAANTVVYATTAGAATIATLSVANTAAAVSFGSNDFKFCAPNKHVVSSYQYYIGRQDRVMMMEDGSIEVIQGIASELPTVPSELDSGMTIATLNLPPYPSLSYSYASRIGKTQYGITINRAKNRRYTMRDVGKIDQRLTNMEYYTVLNALEKSADEMTITDSSGLDRFKNGIIVDSFANFTIANTKHEEFSAGIDRAFKELTPQFRSYPIELEISGTSGTVDHGEGATLTYDKITLINQSAATKSRSCTSGFYCYTGNIDMSPEYDAEPDVSTAPDINIDIDLGQAFADFTEALSDFIPLSSVDTDVVSSSRTNSSTSTSGRTTTTRRTTTTTATTTTTSTALNVTDQSSTQYVGDFVTDVNFAPYLRSRDVKLYVEGLRPNTQFWFWFDGVSVTNRVNPAIGNTLNGLHRLNRTNVVKSDANGVLKAIFNIPANTFKVGDRLLEMYDIEQYNSVGDATSKASKVYSGYNFSYETGAVSVTTRTPKFDTTTTTSVDTKTTTTTSVSSTNRRFANNWNGTDPISQTFYVASKMSSDTDLFIDSVDLYFAKKGVNGVRVQIRETVNGYPGNIVLPFSEVTVPASSVLVSTDSSIATNVVFKAPVALKTDTEYAVVVIPVANDPDYRMWVAKTGENDLITGGAIVSDVSSGTLFTSTNSTAWTAYQDENLKFKIYAARFNVASGSITMKPKDYEFFGITNVVGSFRGEELVFQDAANAAGTVSVVAGNNRIIGTGTSFNTTFAIGDYVVLETAANEYEPLKVASIANTTFMTVEGVVHASNTAANYFSSQVGRVDYINTRAPARLHLKDSSVRSGKVFTVGATLIGATSGASAVIDTIENQRISYVQPHVYRTDFSKTRTTLQYILNGTTYSADFNDNKYLTGTQHYIYSRSNEITGGLSNSFSMRVGMQNTSSTTKDTSPFVDHAITTATVFEYLLDETKDASYVSKIVQLSDGLDAEDFKLFLTAYRPAASDVEVYVKFLAATDPTPIAQVPWTKLSMKNENNFFSSSANRFDFKEFEYFLPTTAKAAGEGAWETSDVINYIAEGGSTYNNFKFFEIKITMKSDNFNKVPRVADMRGIAVS
ncbi:VrlC protein [Sinorhizobium phage phiN3]|uniref:VrlC protein n=1 Tax=Sinorhizobium phage phiN3 TaxID=1647405 RepID=A0A0F6WCM1_9CAUD|nr:VrlC protein [Sinorhizobium phage phiN3]AKF13370.1 VrlC protein [Sinorhizobium phage phiN3]